MLRNPAYTPSHPTTTATPIKNKKSSTADTNKQQLSQLLEPDFPEHVVKWNKAVCPPCKGVYTWISSPRAMYNNRKMIKLQIPK